MHIVYVTSEFPGERKIGGLATYVNNISAIMSAKGHKVTVLTLSDWKDSEYTLENGVKVIGVKIYHYKGKYFHKQKGEIQIVIDAWHIYKKLKLYVKSNKVDVVQSANIYGMGLFRTKVPTVVRLSSDSIVFKEADKFIFDRKYFDGKFRFDDWMEYITEKRADAVFGPGNIIGSVVSKRIHRHVSIIESPFYMENLKEDAEIYQKKLSQKKYFLTHGSLHNIKGTKVVAESLHRLLDKYKNIYFVFVGIDYRINKNGATMSAVEYLKRAAKEYRERVIYLGVLQKNQLVPVIKNAMACILPGRIENLSNACIEAMGLGKIVIATANAGYGQLITHRESGILFKRDSPVALEKAVDYFLAMDDTQKEKMECMAQEIIGRLDAEHCYQKLLKLYETVIEGDELYTSQKR